MCVLMLIDRVKPTSLMIEKAWDTNDDGGGLAWREKGEVVWKKGIEKVEEMKELIKELPMPLIAHFRVASSGGIRPSLTHPFPVSKTSPINLEGRTKGYVLFHNGDWKTWSETARIAAIHSNTPIPAGRWSDSRAMAWLCSIYGLGFMEFLPDQKGIAFGPADMEIFTGHGWVKVFPNGGNTGEHYIWCSNEIFMHRGSRFDQQGPSFALSKYCRYGTCTRKDTDDRGYCADHKDGVSQAYAKGVHGKPESGGAPVVTPFPILPPGQIISLEIAEKLHKEKDQTGKKLLSKGLIKKIRRIYGDMGEKGRRGEKAKRDLEKVSRSLTGSGPAR